MKPRRDNLHLHGKWKRFLDMNLLSQGNFLRCKFQIINKTDIYLIYLIYVYESFYDNCKILLPISLEQKYFSCIIFFLKLRL